LDSQWTETKYNKGICQKELKNYEEATKVFDQVNLNNHNISDY